MTVSRPAFRALRRNRRLARDNRRRGGAVEPADDFWPALKRDLFQNREISERPDFVALDAPMKAEDAALVPMTMSLRQPQGDSRRVVKMSLIIDENPVPLAGTFTIGEKSGVVQIETRVRVNADTVDLVAELSDGSLTESKRYVHAAGGCSAPSTKTLDALGSSLGQLKFRLLTDLVRGRQTAVVMIRHPNFTGMQMDDSTHDYTPARYVNHFAVYQATILCFRSTVAFLFQRTRISASPSRLTRTARFGSRLATTAARASPPPGPSSRAAAEPGLPRNALAERLPTSTRRDALSSNQPNGSPTWAGIAADVDYRPDFRANKERSTRAQMMPSTQTAHAKQRGPRLFT